MIHNCIQMAFQVTCIKQPSPGSISSTCRSVDNGSYRISYGSLNSKA